MQITIISKKKSFNNILTNIPITNKYLNILIHFIFSLLAEIIIAIINKKLNN